MWLATNVSIDMNTNSKLVVLDCTMQGQNGLGRRQRPFLSFTRWEDFMEVVSESFAAQGIDTLPEDKLLQSFGKHVERRGSVAEKAHWNKLLVSV